MILWGWFLRMSGCWSSPIHNKGSLTMVRIQELFQFQTKKTEMNSRITQLYYPLVNSHNYVKSPWLVGKLTIKYYKSPCSIAILVTTRGKTSHRPLGSSGTGPHPSDPTIPGPSPLGSWRRRLKSRDPRGLGAVEPENHQMLMGKLPKLPITMSTMLNFLENHQIFMGTLTNSYWLCWIFRKIIWFQWEKSPFLWPFSIAMWVITRGWDFWLVVCIPTPLKNMVVRQLGWWHSQLNGKIRVMFQTTNQLVLVKRYQNILRNLILSNFQGSVLTCAHFREKKHSRIRSLIVVLRPLWVVQLLFDPC